MKRPLTILLLLTGASIHAQPSIDTIKWGSAIIINNVPVFSDAHKVSKSIGDPSPLQGKYGSQYARLLKLKNGNWLAGYTISRNNGYKIDPNGGLEIEVSLSTDQCRTWKKISILTDRGRDLDNVQLIELPDGAILLAGRSVRWQESYTLPVYKSTNKGKSWKRLSVIDDNHGSPAQLGKPDKGMYEPHFYFLNDGRLSVMYANEKHVTETPSYSQIISQKISPDMGKTWGKEIWVAYEPGHNSSRPGMSVCAKMKNGRYMVVYEICGPENCNIYYKISDDGISWPVGLGKQIPDQLAAPYILSLKNGGLVVTSNKSNISVSNDFGLTWKTVWPAWPKTLWPSIYQIGNNEIGVVNSVQRSEGGHNIQIKLGNIE